MIRAIYCNTDEFKKAYRNISGLMKLIPESFYEEVYKYRTSDYQYTFISGIILIKEILKYFNYNPDNIIRISRDEFSKPFIDNKLSYNISHSGDIVACAGSLISTVSIDIEKIRPVELNRFIKVLTPEEFRSINNANDSIYRLFELWTKKESIIKADGRGLTIDLREVIIKNNTGYIKNSDTRWYLKKITQLKGYTGYICCNKPVKLNGNNILKIHPGMIIK